MVRLTYNVIWGFCILIVIITSLTCLLNVGSQIVSFNVLHTLSFNSQLFVMWSISIHCRKRFVFSIFENCICH